jgi:hypothetical protein
MNPPSPLASTTAEMTTVALDEAEADGVTTGDSSLLARLIARRASALQALKADAEIEGSGILKSEAL